MNRANRAGSREVNFMTLTAGRLRLAEVQRPPPERPPRERRRDACGGAFRHNGEAARGTHQQET